MTAAPSDSSNPPEASAPLLLIGGSAGSLSSLIELVGTLPTDLDAAVLVCQHTSEDGRSRLPHILARHSPLPAAWARDSEPLDAGRIYIAPAAHHLLVNGDSARLSSGPRVNRVRPSVDVLFASAARAAGPASTAVVLSGVLDDGAVGAALIDLAGGRVFVEDPATARFAGMPSAALAAAPKAKIMKSQPISHDVVAGLVRPPSGRGIGVRAEGAQPVMTMRRDVPDDPGFLLSGESRLTRLGCPDCGGGLAQVDLPQISYFRCHVGHQYAPQSLAAAQAEASEHKLWSAVAALEEQAVIQHYLAGLPTAEASQDSNPGTFRSSAQELADRAALLREQLQSWFAEPTSDVESES